MSFRSVLTFNREPGLFWQLQNGRQFTDFITTNK
jgi:hypothetical protein